MHMQMSRSGSAASRCRSWATTRLATSSSMGEPTNTMRSSSRRLKVSKDRSPRGSCRTTMGTRRATVWLLMRRTVACNSMVARDITLPLDRDEAWACLTVPEQLEDWFAERAELELREGGSAGFTLSRGERRRGGVEEGGPGRRPALLGGG